MNPHEVTQYALAALESARGYQIADAAQQLINAINSFREDPGAYSQCLVKTAMFLVQTKEIDNPTKLDKYEELLMFIVRVATESRFRVGIEALRVIFDCKHDFYQNNRLDREINFPIGRENPLPRYYPKLFEYCDVVKPYITTTSLCSWVRCQVLAISTNGVYTVKYSNSNEPTVLKDLPWFAPLGTRCKDHDWKMNLKPGDVLDAQDSKSIWWFSTIAYMSVYNGVKKVRVTFREFTYKGDKIDSEGRKYRGMGPNYDYWFDVMSPRLKFPHTMHKNICYYSATNQTYFVIEDSYDVIYEEDYKAKPYYAVIRVTFNKSLTLVSLFDLFVKLGGVEIYEYMLTNPEALDTVCYLSLVMGNMWFIPPLMAVEKVFRKSHNLAIECIKSNYKNMTGQRLYTLVYFIENSGKRLLTIGEKLDLFEQLRRDVILLFLPLNLYRQLIAIKLIIELIKPVRPLTDHTKRLLIEYLEINGIFYKIYNSSTHEQIITRSNIFLKFFLYNNLLGYKEILYLWNLYPMTDHHGRTVLEKMLGDVVTEMQYDHVELLINKVLEIKETDITIDNLNLLRALKNKLYSRECTLRMLQYLWDLLTTKSAGVKHAVEEYAEKVFKGFVSGINDLDIKFQLLRNMLKRLQEVKVVRGYPALLKEYISTYKAERPADEKSQSPASISEVINYLVCQGIYSINANIIVNQKSYDKIKEMLQFTKYLINNDKNNTDLLNFFKEIFLKFGPTDNTLNWLKEVAPKSKYFLSWFFQITNMYQFKSLNLYGFKAIQSMLIDLNVEYHKITYLKGKITIEPKDAATNTTKDFMEIEYNYKRYFIYVMCSPMEVTGLSFLERLLEVVTNQLTSSKILYFIIALIVSLHESLFDKTLEVRQNIISMILQHIAQVRDQPVFNDEMKQRLVRNLNLLNQLMIETEADGLFDISPHFYKMEFELINLKVENNYPNNKYEKEFTIIVPDNICLWRFKIILGYKIGYNPKKIALSKAKKQFEKKQNGKSLRDLNLGKDETVKIDEAVVDEIPQMNLLNDDATGLAPKFYKIVDKWVKIFGKFQDNDYVMYEDDMMRFFKEHTRKKTEDNYIKNILDNYGNGLFVTLQQFKTYVFASTVENLKSMWRFLNLSGYRNDLKHSSEPALNLPVEILPRQILSNYYVYQLLFELLNNPILKPVHQEIYKFLCTLPTSPKIMGCLGREDFNPSLIETITCIYQLSYLTNIIYASINNDRNIFITFAERGGLDFLCAKIESFGFDKEKSVYDVEDKNVIANILKIMSEYCFVALCQDPLIFSLYSYKLNGLEMNELTDFLEKKIVNPVETSISFSNLLRSKVSLDFKRMANIGYTILKNLMFNYKNSYFKEATIEATKLCTVTHKVVDPDLNLLFNGLAMESLNMRRACANIIYLYCILNEEAKQKIATNLLSNLPTEETRSVSAQYFALVLKLIEKRGNFDYERLCQYLMDKVLYQKFNEKRNTSNSNDVLLQGYLRLIHSILNYNVELCRKMLKYKHLIVNRCLFFNKPLEKLQYIILTKEDLVTYKQSTFFYGYVICKSETSRKFAMDIVILLQRAEKDNPFVESLLTVILEQVPWKIRKSGYKDTLVGMYNMGCICYINAMVQTLSYVYSFRNGLLMTENDGSKKLLYELQKLMSYLYFSERMDYFPEEILKSFNPAINPMVQQDTTEFLGSLFDNLESQMKETPYRDLVKSIFQGTTVVEMSCHSCKKKRYRTEEFFYYSVGIKEKNSLEEALYGMHMGYVINDFLCEECGLRSDFTKRSMLSSLPNIMMIHLQRIVFNLDTFMNTKIHTRLPFPFELNMYPFMQEGIYLRESVGIYYMKKLSYNEEEMKRFKEKARHNKDYKDYLMKLKAIIIHSGSADVGHYYTIMKQDGKWIKLDDSRTSIFTYSSIESECYGGTFTNGYYWAQFASQSKNAYVLIYEKEVKTPIKLHLADDRQHEISKLQLKEVPSKNEFDYSSFKTYNIYKFYRYVWLDNHNLMLYNHLFGYTYCKDFMCFIENLLLTYDGPMKPYMILDVFMKVSTQSGEPGKLADQLACCYIDYEICKRFLKERLLLDKLFHNEKNVRITCSRIMAQMILTALKKNYDDSRTYIFYLLDYMLQNLNTEIAKVWARCYSYFLLMRTLVEASQQIPCLYMYILSRHLIAQYIDFIMEKDSPIKLCHKRHQMGSKFTAVEFSAGVYIISRLLKTSYLFLGANVEQNRPPEHYLYHLDRDESIALSFMPFYTKMIKERQNNTEIGEIIHRLAIKNLRFSEEISRVILRCLGETMDRSHEVKGIMELVERLLQIQDEFSVNRMELLLGYGKLELSKNYTLSSIDHDVYFFMSTIEDIFPIECVLSYMLVNKNMNQLTTLYILAHLFQMADKIPWLVTYLFRQPSPNHTGKHYHDWIKPYLQNVKAVLSQQKVDQQEVDKYIQIALTEYEKYERRIKDWSTPELLITGKVLTKKESYRQKTNHPYVLFYTNMLEVFCLESKPSFENSTNYALDKYLTNGKLLTKNLDAESTILNFMTPIDPPIALRNDEKMIVEENVQAYPLFGDIPEPERYKMYTYQIIITKPKKEPPVRIDVEGVQAHNVLLEIVVENKSDVNKWIRVEFNPSLTLYQCNYRYPLCVSDSIRANDTQSMIVLPVYDYKKGRKIEFVVYVYDGNKHKKTQNNLPSNFKLYGIEPEVVKEIPVEPPVETKPVQYKMEMYEPQQFEKQCQACTSFNELDAVACCVCYTPF